MKRVNPALVLLLAACSQSAEPTISEAPLERSWRFENGPLGEEPGSFESITGEWRVALCEDSPDGPKILVQQPEEGAARKALVLAKKFEWTDLLSSVSIQPLSDDSSSHGGIAFRVVDRSNYYCAIYDVPSRQFRLLKLVNGEEIELASGQVELNLDKWHTISVRMQGDRIQCLLDAGTPLSAVDETFRGPGRVGLCTGATALTRFDGFHVQELRTTER